MDQIKNFDSLNISNKTSVLIIFPHPDDEMAFTAGFMQKALKKTNDVTLICLTKGEASTLKFGLKENESLAEAREIELKNACNVLNLKNVIIEDFGDGTLSSKTVELKSFLNEKINQINPTVVITYEPQGVYGHPDHIIVSEIVTKISREKNIELLYATVTNEINFTEGTKAMAANPEEIKPLEPNLIIKLNIFEFINKLRALNEHKTQMGEHKKSAIETLKRILYLKKEYYYLLERY